MAEATRGDEGQVLRGISWRECFPFVHIFRAFRIAIHPSKLMLGLVAILLLYAGGRFLDWAWSVDSSAVPNEIPACYLRENQKQSFEDCRKGIREPLVKEAAEAVFALDQRIEKEADRQFKKREDALDWVRNNPGKAYSKFADAAKTAREKAIQAADDKYKEDQKSDNKDVKANADKARKDAYAKAYDDEYAAKTNAKLIKNVGLFETFLTYQAQELNAVWEGVLGGNWLGGFPRATSAVDGVIASTIKFFTVAPGWALRHHWLYFILYGAWFLIVWSIFAGAISRIAAVQVADEGRKLSIRQGIGFAVSKFLSFISAPMIPVLIIVIIGVLVGLAGLLFFGIPGWSAVVGVIGAAVFFLALAAGFVMTLVLMGAIGGFNLMYPTVAVEGSDSFDAISRSFSYVYARPWRMLWYTLIAIGYGALTYLFVRLFIYFMLLLTHYSVGLFVFRDAANGQQVLDAMWPVPTWVNMTFGVIAPPLNAGNAIAAYIIAIWVHIVIALLGAFAISFFLSANTIIYYLMRREVDATEMDDVYLEQPEEELAEPATPAPAGEAAAAPTTAGGTATETSSTTAVDSPPPNPPAPPPTT